MKNSTYYNDIFLPTPTDNADITKVSDAIDGVAGKTYTHENATNPHNITKATVGLNNVDNVKQAPNTHLTDANAHNDVLAPKDHAASTTTYGKGTSTNYGHLKLSDAIDSTSTVSGGIAATPKAVKQAYDEAIASPFVTLFSASKTFTTRSVDFGTIISEHIADCCAFVVLVGNTSYTGDIYNGFKSNTASNSFKPNTKRLMSGREFAYLCSAEGAKFYVDGTATDLTITLIGVGVRV